MKVFILNNIWGQFVLNIDWTVHFFCVLIERFVTEVTALRAQLAEMKQYSLVQEQEIREEQRKEYDELVHNLFHACYTLRQKLDEHR